MIQAGLPHARGGVSFLSQLVSIIIFGLPHARGGVSESGTVPAFIEVVFPTHVGVFLQRVLANAAKKRLPHARGGVSEGALTQANLFEVFPTHVGVFPNLSG